ncbi:hypothetical protein [Vibrio crassostreae]|uniref:hypothetical protein n=1 Tax=Vibrio crassostreae TaxID=246167 RepID=UPI001B30DD53|nr:hypothetical protein [Vibrio crassostreae]
MKTSIDTKFQVVNLEQASKSSRSIVKSLREQRESDFELVVERDGYLIRYTTPLAQQVGIEAMIERLKLFNMTEVSDGNFCVLEERSSVWWVLKVQKWIPRTFEAISSKNQVNTLMANGVWFISGEGDFNESTDFENSETLFQLPSFEVGNEHLSRNSELRQKMIFGSAVSIALIIALAWGYSKLTEPDVKQELTQLITTNNAPEEIDNFKHFREFQKNRVSVGRALYGLEPIVIMLRQDQLPPHWSFPLFEYKNGVVVGTAKSVFNGGLGKPSELAEFLSSQRNGNFVFHDGQFAKAQIEIEKDGLGLVGNILPLRPMRDLLLSRLVDQGANDLYTAESKDLGNFRVQSGEVTFNETDYTAIGRLSRTFANKPIYIDKLNVAATQDKLAITIGFTLVGN